MYGQRRAPRHSMRSGLIALVLIATTAALATSAGGVVNPNTELVPLTGVVHRQAHSDADLGEAPRSLHLTGLDIVFSKTPAQERALQQLLSDQKDRSSPRYHRWLTPAEYGQRFGVSDTTLTLVSEWLNANGLTIGTLPAARGHLPFFGSKAQIENALHTPIHVFDLQGETHYANASVPMIPLAIRSSIVTIRGLSDFHPKPGVRRQRAPQSMWLQPRPNTYYSGSGQYPGYVGPTDFAIMYNLQPEYELGVTGVGVTVAIAAQSDLDASVLTAFWSGFNVAGPNFALPAQQFQSIPVPSSSGGVDPGESRNGNEDEAFLDTEIVGALAPGAQLVLVRDQDASVAAQYAIDQNLGAVLNLSFSQCEANLGSDNAAVNAMYEQAASQGITVIVSTDDTGTAGCTASADFEKQGDVDTNGFAVNGLASTPYDLAVGGTDFDPTVEVQYWTAVNQFATFASALSHIPEVAWNGSCASTTLAELYLSSTPLTFCNTAKLKAAAGGQIDNPFIQIIGGGGGVSSCTTTNTDGTCARGYPTPSWQTGFGIGNYGARAVPDVSMIATRWLMCSYDITTCDPSQAPTFPPTAASTIEVVDGTSASAPAVSAIIAMLDQTQITHSLPDGRQGLVNPLLYGFASSEFQNPTVESLCSASQGPMAAAPCVFYDVISGSNAQPCNPSNYISKSTGTLPASTCFSQTGNTAGLMQVDGSQDYDAGIGFDLATGIGSINAAGLIASVQSPTTAPTGLSGVTSGQTATLSWNTDANATSGYDIYQGGFPGVVGTTPIQQNVAATTVAIPGLQFGQSYTFAIAAVTSGGISARTLPIQLTVVPSAPIGLMVQAAGATTFILSWAQPAGANTYSIFGGPSTQAPGNDPILKNITSTSITLGDLTPGQEYIFSVSAQNAGGTSAPSAPVSESVVPAAPAALDAVAGNESVTLTWSAPKGAYTYQVFEGSTAGQESAQPVKTGVSGTQATIGGLTNGTIYYFTVAAVGQGGVSAPSSEASATPVAPPSSGGGGLDWLTIAGLGILLGLRSGVAVLARYSIS